MANKDADVVSLCDYRRSTSGDSLLEMVRNHHEASGESHRRLINAISLWDEWLSEDDDAQD